MTELEHLDLMLAREQHERNRQAEERWCERQIIREHAIQAAGFGQEIRS